MIPRMLRVVTLFVVIVLVCGLPVSAQQKLPTQTPRPSSPEKIIKHLRSNKGIAFPDEKVLNRPTGELPKFVFDDKSREFIRKLDEDYVKRNTIVLTIADCKKDQTTTEAFSYPQLDLRPDVLYVRADEVPIDAKEAFGDHTELRRYRNDKLNAESMIIASLRIPCLPYRVRVVNTTIYRDHGLNALKNYQDDPEGPGVLKDQVRFLLEKKGKL